MEYSTRRFLRSALILLLLSVVGLGLSACAHKNVRGGAPGMQGAGMGNNNGQTTDMSSGGNPDVDGLAGIPAGDRHLFQDPNNPLSTRVIYFPTDGSDIPSQYSSAIQAHGRYLSQHPNVSLRLEGNTDERGTREYNVALGERRAQSVKQALVLAGANANQVNTISYGEERPAVLGHTPDDYAKNRRVVFNYPAPMNQ